MPGAGAWGARIISVSVVGIVSGRTVVLITAQVSLPAVDVAVKLLCIPWN